MLIKPKIFVRYPGGGGGHFLSLLILALRSKIELTDAFSGHPQAYEINTGHNFDSQWDVGIDAQLSTGKDLNTATNWLLDNFSFSQTLRKFYLVHTHAEAFEPILQAWPESKIITISCNKSDMAQLAFNFVVKAGASHSDSSIADRIRIIQHRYNMLRSFDADNKAHIKLIRQNLKLFTYVILYSWPDLSKIYTDERIDERLFNISFQDIYQGNYTNFLDTLIEFLKFNVSRKNYQKATDMIQQYASAQKVVPWDLPVDCYIKM